MNELARRILFNNLQLSRGNRNKKIEKTLMNDLMAFKKLPSTHDMILKVENMWVQI